MEVVMEVVTEVEMEVKMMKAEAEAEAEAEAQMVRERLRRRDARRGVLHEHLLQQLARLRRRAPLRQLEPPRDELLVAHLERVRGRGSADRRGRRAPLRPGAEPRWPEVPPVLRSSREDPDRDGETGRGGQRGGLLASSGPLRGRGRRPRSHLERRLVEQVHLVAHHGARHPVELGGGGALLRQVDQRLAFAGGQSSGP